MPQIALAGLAGGLGAVGSAIVGGSVASLTLSTVLGAALVSAGSTAIQMALSSNPQVPAASLQIKQATPSGQFVFGRARVSGTATFIDNNGKSIWVVIPIACHEIDGIEEIYDGENLIWTPAGNEPDYVGKINVYNRLGSSAQTSIPSLENAFSFLNGNFRGRGNAYIALKLTDFNNKWGGQLPQVWAKVRGAKPFDPRTSTTAWTANWALNVAYYMQHPKGGNRTNINTAALIASANISDEDIPDNSMLAGEEVWANGNNGTDRTHKRYEVNGAFSTAAVPKQILTSMIPYGIGDIYESNGEYHVHAGANSAPVAYFTKDDFLEVPQIGSQIKIEDEVDGVRARYADSSANFVANDAPEVIFNPADPQRFLDNLDLTAEPHPERAQRLMALMGRKTMRRIAMSVVFPISAMAVEVGDRINVEFPEVGISADFEVKKKGILLGPQGSRVAFELLEDSAAYWAWDKDDAGAVVASSKSTLASVTFVTPPTLLTFSEPEPIAASGRFEKFLRISFTESADPYLSHYVVRWTVDGIVTERSIESATVYDIPNPVPGTLYSIEVFAVNSLGVSSATISGSHPFIGRSTILLSSPYITYNPLANPFIGKGLTLPNGVQESEFRTVEANRITFTAARTEYFCSYSVRAFESSTGLAYHTIFAAVTDQADNYTFDDGQDIEDRKIENSRTRSVGNNGWFHHNNIFRVKNLIIGGQYRIWLLLQNNYGFNFSLGNIYTPIDRNAEFTMYEEKR